jgi:magnesium chelatase family protein
MRPSFDSVLAKVTTFTIDGVRSRRITVEVDLHPGLPAFTIVGLGDQAVRESRERVRTAIQNSGYTFPQNRVTVNLAPAYLRKQGPGFDLAIAIGILAAAGEVPGELLDRIAVYGELALGGELRAARGSLAVAEGTRDAEMSALVVPYVCGREAALIGDIGVHAVDDLRAVTRVFAGEGSPGLPDPEPALEEAAPQRLDLSDVRGHVAAVAALETAAAGGHSILLSGVPGTGKTMLARRLPSILPPLSSEEAIEVTRIHSIAGLHRGGGGLLSERPFRAPHHTISSSGLVGGGAIPMPGEATLAHHGVLFLDELAEFARPALEALRQPLEDGRVAIVRGQRSALYPTQTMLVASTNPCPCGYLGQPRCKCGEADIARYRRRLSGPLLDRIDITIEVERPTAEELRKPSPHESDEHRARVVAARGRQTKRLGATGCNGRMGVSELREHVRLDAASDALLHNAYAKGRLSPRGHARVLRVARTIADLRASERVERKDLLQAIHLRRETNPDANGEEEAA